MMKIFASLAILALCATVCYGVVTPTSQSGAIATSALNNSFVTSVIKYSNDTDKTNWFTKLVAGCDVYFGPGTTNTTSYVYGLVPGADKYSAVVKRTLSNTIVGYGNDTTEASVTTTDTTLTQDIVAKGTTAAVAASTVKTAVGPGYLAILSQGDDAGLIGVKITKVYLTLVGSSVSSITAGTYTNTVFAAGTTDQNQFTAAIGSVFYDVAAGAFFYTYTITNMFSAKSAADANAAATAAANKNTVYLGGVFVNGSRYWTTDLAITPATAVNVIANVIVGNDNFTNSSNIYVVYKDTTASPKITYVSKTTKATATTAAGAPSTLQTDDVTANAAKTYTPIGVWSSVYTYGISLGLLNQTAAATNYYQIKNYLNGSTTGTDSGAVTATSGNAAPNSAGGWPLNTGFSQIGVFPTATNPTYVLGSFFANGTANGTQTTLGTLQGPVSFYADVNGSTWVGWTDYDTVTPFSTYNAYLAKLQGQIYSSTSSASILATILSFVALFIASIFAF